jgi:hypothetical protein
MSDGSPFNPSDAAQRTPELFDPAPRGRVARTASLRNHPIIPNHHFSAASAECIECFKAGNYYAAISLSQAIAESLSSFVVLRHHLKGAKDLASRIRRLRASSTITTNAADAFLRIWQNRDDYHHLNPAVPTQMHDLERKALANVQDLTLIEEELFEFRIEQGALIPVHPEYCDSEEGSGRLAVYLQIDT